MSVAWHSCRLAESWRQQEPKAPLLSTILTPRIFACGRDPKNPGRTTGRCAIQPAKLLGTDLTYRYGGSDNTLFPFGYGLSCASPLLV